MALDNLIVRAALRSDLPQLLRLYEHLHPADRKLSLEIAKQRHTELKKYPGSDILIGLADEKLVSSCTLIVIPNLTRGGLPYALIENVVTHDAHRRRGFGRQLLATAVVAAWDSDCYKVMLMTGSQRPSTHAFYTAAGFDQNKTGFTIRRPIATTP